MERHFLFALFLYLLSILLALAENRTELKMAGPVSRWSYLAGAGVALAILAAAAASPEGIVWDFFTGILVTHTALAAVYLAGRFFGHISWAPAAFSAVSLFLGSAALIRGRDAMPAASDAASGAGAHVACMFAALTAFTLSFIFSALFLTQDRLLKRRSTGALVSALPPLELTSRLNFAAITVGTAALAMGVFGGTAALRRLAHPREILMDPSVILSVLMLVLYAGLAVVRKGALERARTVSVVSIVFYWLLVFVFLGAHLGGAAAGR